MQEIDADSVDVGLIKPMRIIAVLRLCLHLTCVFTSGKISNHSKAFFLSISLGAYPLWGVVKCSTGQRAALLCLHPGVYEVDNPSYPHHAIESVVVLT